MDCGMLFAHCEEVESLFAPSSLQTIAGHDGTHPEKKTCYPWRYFLLLLLKSQMFSRSLEDFALCRQGRPRDLTELRAGWWKGLLPKGHFQGGVLGCVALCSLCPALPRFTACWGGTDRQRGFEVANGAALFWLLSLTARLRLGGNPAPNTIGWMWLRDTGSGWEVGWGT